MKIIWSPLAISRVTEIAEYILMDNPVAAEKWVDEIFNRVMQLKTYPKSGRMVPELEIEEIRELKYGNYRIIYRIIEKAIVVLTVRHGRQILPEQDLK